MQFNEGLPARVFGELGVTRYQVEAFARSGGAMGKESAAPQKLYSPEEAATTSVSTCKRSAAGYVRGD